MVSTGSDHRMRLWDIVEGRNTLVNYPETLNSNRKAQAFARMLFFLQKYVMMTSEPLHGGSKPVQSEACMCLVLETAVAWQPLRMAVGDQALCICVRVCTSPGV
jgi:hypothetical protein